jgi:hypothetical protein
METYIYEIVLRVLEFKVENQYKITTDRRTFNTETQILFNGTYSPSVLSFIVHLLISQEFI